MLASYPMYNQPETQMWVDRWWQAVVAELDAMGVDGPLILTQPKDYYAHWQAHDLLLSQTCGYPLTHALQGKVQYLITPCYDSPYNQGAYYCSLLLVSEQSALLALTNGADMTRLAGLSLAYNSLDSQSGYHCLRPLLAGMGINKHADFFGPMLPTGGHRQSLAMVQQGQAQLCAVDCVTYALLAKHAPQSVAGLRLVGTTPQVPGLPLITSLMTSADVVDQLRTAIFAVQKDADMAGVMGQLLIKDWQVLPLAEYEVLK